MLVPEAIDRADREIGATRMVITHNTAIAGMAHRVVRLRGGRIVGRAGQHGAPGAGELSW